MAHSYANREPKFVPKSCVTLLTLTIVRSLISEGIYIRMNLQIKFIGFDTPFIAPNKIQMEINRPRMLRVASAVAIDAKV